MIVTTDKTLAFAERIQKKEAGSIEVLTGGLMQKKSIRWKVTTLPDDGQTQHSEAQHRYWAQQAISHARIEGFVPDQALLDDMEQVIQNTMTDDEAVARCIARGNDELDTGNRPIPQAAPNTTQQLARYETAQHILGMMIVGCSKELDRQLQQPVPEGSIIEKCESDIAKYIEEEAQLFFRDAVNIERIITTYGPRVRALFDA